MSTTIQSATLSTAPSTTIQEYSELKRVHISTLKSARRSAAHYRHAVQYPPKDKTHFALGRATHLAVTQPELFEAVVTVWPADLGRRYGKRWDAFKDEHEGKTILTAAEHAECVAMAHAVRSNPLALEFLTGGHAEAPMLWTDPETGIDCKGLVDFVTPRGIVDLKTTKDASIEGFGREVWRYGYHLQAAFYVDGWASSHKGVRLPFVFIAVEKEPPYVCTIFRAPDDVLERGREEVRELLALVKTCREQKRWPGYAEGIVDLVLPRWAMPREENLDGLGIDFAALGPEGTESEGKEASP
jgi:hypothetical protein